MKNDVKSICDRLIKNRNNTVRFFHNEKDNAFFLTPAFIFTTRGMVVDGKDIDNCVKEIKESGLNRFEKIFVASKMSLVDDSEGYLSDVLWAYSKIRKRKLKDTGLDILASVLICDAGKVFDTEQILDEAEFLLEKMKNKHPYYVEDADLCAAILLVLSERNTSDIFADIESMYREMKDGFSGNYEYAYSLCQMLATYKGESEEKSGRMLELFSLFKEKQLRFGKNSLYSVAALLADVSDDAEAIAEEAEWVSGYLSKKRSFSFLSMANDERIAYAAFIVYLSYFRDEQTISTRDEGACVSRAAVHRTMLFAIMKILIGKEKQKLKRSELISAITTVAKIYEDGENE